MFQPKFDIYEKMETPDVYLCNIDNSIIGALKVTDLQLDLVYNDVSDTNAISFKVYRQYQDSNGKTVIQPFYDAVEAMRKILIKDIGYFLIDEPALTKNAASEYKAVSAIGTELEFQDKYLEYFYINNGDDLSIDDVSLLNNDDTEHSLMHLILEDIPYWSIGHIDECLVNLQRHFEVDKQDVYSFLMNDFSKDFDAYVEFDTLNSLINIYQVDNYGIDTDVFVSADVLAKEMNVKHSRDDIKTYYTVTGSDDLDVRAVNLGNAGIWNLSYYHTPEWMGTELFEAYSEYLIKIEEVTETYISVLSELNDIYLVKEELINRFPTTDLDTTVWSEHGLISLRQKETENQLILDTMKEDGMNVPTHAQYARWVAQNNLVQAIKSNIIIRELEIEKQNGFIEAKSTELSAIGSQVSMKNNFSDDQLVILGRLKKPDDYQNDYYLITEDEDESSILETQLELLAAAQKDLAEKACPQYSFTMSMPDIFTIKTFEKLHNQFQVGNYIHVGLRENVITKVRLLKIHIEFDNPDGFSAEFGSFTYRDIYSGSGLNSTDAKSLQIVKNNSSTWNTTVQKVETIETDIQEVTDSVVNLVETITIVQTTADGKNAIYTSTAEPTYACKNDIWYKKNGDKIEMWFYDGEKWVPQVSDLTGEEVKALVAEVEETSKTTLEEVNNAVAAANNASALSTQALTLAQSVNSQIPGIQSNASTALTQAQEALDAYNSMEIGGRNLFLNSGDFSTGWGRNVISSYSIVTDDVPIKGTSAKTYKWKGISGNSYVGPYQFFRQDTTRITKFTKNKKYSVSVWLKASADCNLYLRVEGGGILTKSVMLSDVWQYVTFTFTADGNKDVITFYGRDSTGTVSFYMSMPMLIEGDMPMNWSPAPEDIQFQFVTINNELLSKVTQTTFNALQGTVNSQSTLIQQNIADIALKANQSTVDTLTSRVTSAEASILVNANAVALKASASDVNVLTGRVSATESSLTTQAGKITALNSLTDGHTTKIGSLQIGYAGLTSTVSQVQTDFNNLSIGGTNLWLKSSVEDSFGRWTAGDGTKTIANDFLWNGKPTIKFVKGSTAAGGINTEARAGLPANTQFTYSFMVYSSVASNVASNSLGHMQVVGSDGSATGLHRETSLTYNPSTISANVWTKVSITFNTPVEAFAGETFKFISYLWYLQYGATYYFADFQLEKGDKATDYSPAPEDIDSQFTSINQTIDSIQTTVDGKASTAQITLLENLINMRVTTGDIINQININEKGVQIDGSCVQITGTTYIADAVIKAANIASVNASTITTGALNAATVSVINLNASNIVSGTLNAGIVSVTNLNASNIVSGTLKSSNYAYSSGSYSTTGTSIDLTNGNITTPNFAVNSSSGAAYFKGSAYLDNGLYMWFTAGQSGGVAAYKQVMNVGTLSGASVLYVNEDSYFPKNVIVEGALSVMGGATFSVKPTMFNENIRVANGKGVYGYNTSMVENTLVAINTSNQCLVGSSSLQTVIRGSALTLSPATSMSSTLSVSGTTTLNSTLTVAGTTTLRGNLYMNGIGVHLRGSNHYINSAANNQVRISAGGVASDVILGISDSIWCLRPATTNQLSIGSPSYLMYRVYSSQGVLQTSDKNAKNSYRDINYDLARDFVMDLIPASYRLNADDSDTYHEGFYAQDIEKTLMKLGMTLSDFGGVQKYKKADGKYSYALIYEELLPRIVAVVQMHEKTIQQQQVAIQQLLKQA